MIKSIRAVTLLEILTVIIIIGILVALALPNFGTMKERALDREAKANLKLIQAAEKIYRMEVGRYFPVDGSTESAINNINTNLRLSLTERNWDYTVAGGDNLGSQATRSVSGWERNYNIDQDDEEACCCPRDSRCPSQDWCSSCP